MLVSSNLSWLYVQVPKGAIAGRAIAEDNFMLEGFHYSYTLWRELFQNALDASAGEGAVRVSIKIYRVSELDEETLHAIFDADYFSRLNLTVKSPVLWESLKDMHVIVFEDFNTSGLTGTFNDPNVEGAGEHYNSLLFNEGAGGKLNATSANGRAGQGKITFFRLSAARCVLIHTARTDGHQLLIARASFKRTYMKDQQKYFRDGFFCVNIDGVPIPSSDLASNREFCNFWRLNRDGQPGTSLVIPFVPAQINAQSVWEVVCSDFYCSVQLGRLVVTVNGVTLDANNLDEMCSSYLPNDVPGPFSREFRGFVTNAFTAGHPVPFTALENWSRKSKIESDCFAEGVADLVCKAVQEGKLVCIKFPISIRPRGAPNVKTFFMVYFQLANDGSESREAFLRNDLLISNEKHLSSARHLPAGFALTHISDPALANFLNDGEEPSHTKWNASRPLLNENYENPAPVITAVRQAAVRLCGFACAASGGRDFRASADLFPRSELSPTPITPSRNGGRDTAFNRGGGAAEKPQVPPAGPRIFLIESGADFESVSSASGPPQELLTKLPLAAFLQVAYLDADGQSFDSYDPLDFDFSDQTAHQVVAENCEVISRAENVIRISILDFPFRLTVTGLDQNLHRKVRFNADVSGGGDGETD